MELILSLLLLAAGRHAATAEPLQYVDQLIGTQAGGELFLREIALNG